MRGRCPSCGCYIAVWRTRDDLPHLRMCPCFWTCGLATEIEWDTP